MAAPGEHHANELHLMFVAKGGGSANKSFLFQETRAILSPERLLKYLDGKMRALGTSACPPYHLAIVIGGTSAELTLKTVKNLTLFAEEVIPRLRRRTDASERVAAE